MTQHVELIYDRSCPNVVEAQQVLRKAFDTVGIESSWAEWDRESPESPAYARRYGSPTILVNGKDVTGQGQNEGQNCCRVYASANGGYKGVPPLDEVVKALQGMRKSRLRWGQFLGAASAIGPSLLPVGVCPACWPTYAGVLGAFGTGFLLNSRYLLPLTVAFLVSALGMLAFRAKSRRGYGPFLLGLFASAGIVVGKFGVASGLLLFSSGAVFVGAALWNAWPKPVAHSCNPCAVIE